MVLVNVKYHKREKIAEPYAPKYDGSIERYTSYLKQKIGGINAREGEHMLSRNGDPQKVPCVSIDSLAGLPQGYNADIVPKNANGVYCLDFIVYTPVYTPEEKKAEFVPNRKGPERATVKFGKGIRRTIYKIFKRKQGMQDLTLSPFKFIKKRWIDLDAMAEAQEARRTKLKERHDDNINNLWLYYTTNINGKPAFVVHIPKDPYAAVSLVKKWLEAMEQLKDS